MPVMMMMMMMMMMMTIEMTMEMTMLMTMCIVFYSTHMATAESITSSVSPTRYCTHHVCPSCELLLNQHSPPAMQLIKVWCWRPRSTYPPCSSCPSARLRSWMMQTNRERALLA
jgi:hypothetical protein